MLEDLSLKKFDKGNTYLMNKLKKNIISVIIFIFVCLIVTNFSSMHQCFSYYKVFGSPTSRIANKEGKVCEVSTLNTLSYKPKKIEFPSSDSNTNLSLGYAKFVLEPKEIIKIELRGFMLAFECEGYSIVFFPPKKPRVFSDIEYVTSFKRELLPEDAFDAQVKIANTLPKTYLQIFFMSKYEFNEHMTFCFLKTAYLHNQNGIGIFENDTIKGVIGFGAAHQPYQMVADVYSKDTSIAQEILVTSDSSKKTEAILFLILSSYKYLIEQPLDDTALKEAIIGAFSSHPLFHLEPLED